MYIFYFLAAMYNHVHNFSFLGLGGQYNLNLLKTRVIKVNFKWDLR
ncbi:MAG: hypothetical protein XD54_1999 [Thermococcus sibiricus]|uniref:Uncharacterized protein n=1 Tax=Thermococcus sibiricus TaxID=172049 RepID=A0A101EK27_9EURY|nr:MAG: hypothetical protein XD54_1999 [Thermococcus sibiricus]KUK27811.1 MAG: hypothetical protein XD61_1649 [Thermococcus sp. 40_45]